jgi:hypothetical protein
MFQDLLDGWGDNNKSPTIDFTVKGFIGTKCVSDSSTGLCFICPSPIKQVSQNQLFLHIHKNNRPPTLSLDKKSDITTNKKQASMYNLFTKIAKQVLPVKHSHGCPLRVVHWYSLKLFSQSISALCGYWQ